MYVLTDKGIDVTGQVLNTAVTDIWQNLRAYLTDPKFSKLLKYINFDDFGLILDPNPGVFVYDSVLSGKINHLSFDKETDSFFNTMCRVVFYFKTQISLSMTPEIFKDIVAKLETLQDKLDFNAQRNMRYKYRAANYFCLKQNLCQSDLFQPASAPAPADSDVCLVVDFGLSVPKEYIQET